MIDVSGVLEPPAGWVDTPEQAQMRACLANALSGHDPAETVRVASEMIQVMRDQFLAGTASVRRMAAAAGRETMTATELAKASGQTRQTVSRLLTEARAM